MANTLQSIQDGFFWHRNGRNDIVWHDIPWGNVCQPKEAGSLGIRNIRPIVAREDSWTWGCEKLGRFSIRSAYHMIVGRPDLGSQEPPQDIPALYCLCGEEEDLDHLFSLLATMLKGVMGIDRTMYSASHSFIKGWNRTTGDPSSREIGSVPHQVRDAKIKFLSGLKQDTEEEKLAWKELSSSLKLDYPKYTPLLAKILDGLVSRSAGDDKIKHNQETINAANEVIDSIDKEELARYFSVKYDPEDDEAEKNKKKMELTRDQLVEALYQKGLALAEIESFKVAKPMGASAPGDKDSEKETKKGTPELGEKDLFEANFKEIKKWVDVKSSKHGLLSVIRERHGGRLGTALKWRGYDAPVC
ncbi:hypothetical protein Taro_039605 [Colocasia esculenta]|uniref:Uncharacterized protein n=1 Tax=Colocasia esculenta TaxID=4460 RepID=A0A843WJE0_COLES|nr:hypothetical protein [Colocasia esculenta]